jgi:hypothetical protein
MFFDPAAPSSAGFTASPILSEADLVGGPSSNFTVIRNWAASTQQGDSDTLPVEVDPPSPHSSQWSELTANAEDSDTNLEYNGDWMSLSFRQRAVEFQVVE